MTASPLEDLKPDELRLSIVLNPEGPAVSVLNNLTADVPAHIRTRYRSMMDGLLLLLQDSDEVDDLVYLANKTRQAAFKAKALDRLHLRSMQPDNDDLPDNVIQFPLDRWAVDIEGDDGDE